MRDFSLEPMLNGLPYAMMSDPETLAEVIEWNSRVGGDLVMVVNQARQPGHAHGPVARNDYTLIGRLLDEGMLGVIVPLVHKPEDAKAVADACRFPPVGERSWGWGRARASGRRRLPQDGL